MNRIFKNLKFEIAIITYAIIHYSEYYFIYTIRKLGLMKPLYKCGNEVFFDDEFYTVTQIWFSHDDITYKYVFTNGHKYVVKRHPEVKEKGFGISPRDIRRNKFNDIIKKI